MSRLLELQSFSAVAEEGGFAPAARRLGLTTSAVSKQVRKLEDRLGVRLFQRTTRRVVATEAGRAFHERIASLLAELDEAERSVTALQGELRGPLRVSVPLDFGRLHLADPLTEFAGQHQALALEVELGDRFVDPVEEGFDAVVRIGALPDSSLVARRLAPCRRVLCASPGYLKQHGTPGRPSELRRHRTLAYAYEAAHSWRFRDSGGRTTHVNVHTRHRTNSGALLRRWMLAGLGIGLAPTFLVGDDLRDGTLVSLLGEALDADIAIYALYPHRRHLSAKVRAFVDHLAQHCGEHPYWDEGVA